MSAAGNFYPTSPNAYTAAPVYPLATSPQTPSIPLSNFASVQNLTSPPSFAYVPSPATGYPNYYYPATPAAPVLTWVPVIKSTPATQIQRPPIQAQVSPGGFPDQARATVGSRRAFDDLFERRPPAPLLEPARSSQVAETQKASTHEDTPPGSAKALSPAERTGKEVGLLVTRLLEDNPQWQSQLAGLSLENIQASADQLKASAQPFLRLVPRGMLRQAINQADPTLRPILLQLEAWLNEGAVNEGEASLTESAPKKRGLLSLRWLLSLLAR